MKKSLREIALAKLKGAGIKVVAGKVAASDFEEALKVLAASPNTKSLLQAIEGKGFRFFEAPWTNNTGNVYNALLIAKDPSLWESHKPSKFPDAFVLGYEFIGDEQEFNYEDTDSVDLKKVESTLKQGQYFKRANPSVSLVGNMIVVSFTREGKKFRLGYSPTGQCGVLDDGTEFLEKAVPEVPDSLILEFYSAVQESQPENKQYLGEPTKVSLNELESLLSKASTKVDKRLRDILSGKAGFWSDIRLDR